MIWKYVCGKVNVNKGVGAGWDNKLSTRETKLANWNQIPDAALN